MCVFLLICFGLIGFSPPPKKKNVFFELHFIRNSYSEYVGSRYLVFHAASALQYNKNHLPIPNKINSSFSAQKSEKKQDMRNPFLWQRKGYAQLHFQINIFAAELVSFSFISIINNHGMSQRLSAIG